MIITASLGQFQIFRFLVIEILHLRIKDCTAVIFIINIQAYRFPVNGISYFSLRLGLGQFPNRMLQQALQNIMAEA